MSFNAPFNYGLGPFGCAGQSAQNCAQDFNGCCNSYGGPSFPQAKSNMTFSPISSLQQIRWFKADRQPVIKTLPVSFQKAFSIPKQGVGVL